MCCNHNIRQLTLKVNVFSLVAYIIILPVKDHHGEDTAGGGGGASDDPVIESADKSNQQTIEVSRQSRFT